jgi:ABC-type lipoprotein export system ATPase subunit
MLIELAGVEKSYPLKGGRSWVLRQINLSVAEGDFLSIMGPSGSGKSSLLNILGLLDGDFEGEYHLAGQAAHKATDKQRKQLAREHIGFIFQHYHLLDDLTVYENLDLPLSYRDVASAERKARVADILDRFQIVGKKDLYPNQLSGGQQQLVAVARAVITRPSLLLADEPTGALHSTQGRMIMDLLKGLNDDGMTIIQVTHNPDYAAVGKRRVELFDGWLQETAPQAGQGAAGSVA